MPSLFSAFRSSRLYVPVTVSLGRARKKKTKKKAKARRAKKNVRIKRWISLELPAGARLGHLKGWGKRRKVSGNPPAWVTNEAKWERAKAIVKPHWQHYEHPWAVVAHVYRRLTHGRP